MSYVVSGFSRTPPASLDRGPGSAAVRGLEASAIGCADDGVESVGSGDRNDVTGLGKRRSLPLAPPVGSAQHDAAAANEPAHIRRGRVAGRQFRCRTGLLRGPCRAAINRVLHDGAGADAPADLRVGRDDFKERHRASLEALGAAGADAADLPGSATVTVSWTVASRRAASFRADCPEA